MKSYKKIFFLFVAVVTGMISFAGSSVKGQQTTWQRLYDGMNKLLKIFMFLILLFISNCSIMQAQSVLWRQILGGQYNELGYDVIELRDKGYLMVDNKRKWS